MRMMFTILFRVQTQGITNFNLSDSNRSLTLEPDLSFPKYLYTWEETVFGSLQHFLRMISEDDNSIYAGC